MTSSRRVGLSGAARGITLPAAQFCPDRGRSAMSAVRRVAADRRRRPGCDAPVATSAPPAVIDYGRGVKLIDATARLVRCSGHAPGACGRLPPNTMVAWPSLSVTAPLRVETVT